MADRTRPSVDASSGGKTNTLETLALHNRIIKPTSNINTNDEIRRARRVRAANINQTCNNIEIRLEVENCRRPADEFVSTKIESNLDNRVCLPYYRGGNECSQERPTSGHRKQLVESTRDKFVDRRTRLNKVSKVSTLGDLENNNNNNNLSGSNPIYNRPNETTQTPTTLNNHRNVCINSGRSFFKSYFNEDISTVSSEMNKIINDSVRVLDLSGWQSSPRSCFESSNGSNSIFSNISTSSSNSSSLAANNPADTPNNTRGFTSLNDFDDEFEMIVLDDESDSHCYKAFDNLTYLSSAEDLTGGDPDLVRNEYEHECGQEDEDEDENFLMGDVLVKKTLKSIKRKDKMRKEARFTLNVTNQSMPDLDTSETNPRPVRVFEFRITIIESSGVYLNKNIES